MVLEILESSIQLLKKSQWIQKANARTRDSRPCHWSDPEAVAFDLEGAVRRSAGDLHAIIWRQLLISYREDPETGKLKKFQGPFVAMISPHKNLFDWNDQRGRQKSEIINFLEDACDQYRYREEGSHDPDDDL